MVIITSDRIRRKWFRPIGEHYIVILDNDLNIRNCGLLSTETVNGFIRSACTLDRENERCTAIIDSPVWLEDIDEVDIRQMVIDHIEKQNANT